MMMKGHVADGPDQRYSRGIERKVVAYGLDTPCTVGNPMERAENGDSETRSTTRPVLDAADGGW